MVCDQVSTRNLGSRQPSSLTNFWDPRSSERVLPRKVTMCEWDLGQFRSPWGPWRYWSYHPGRKSHRWSIAVRWVASVWVPRAWMFRLLAVPLVSRLPLGKTGGLGWEKFQDSRLRSEGIVTPSWPVSIPSRCKRKPDTGAHHWNAIVIHARGHRVITAHSCWGSL